MKRDKRSPVTSDTQGDLEQLKASCDDLQESLNCCAAKLKLSEIVQEGMVSKEDLREIVQDVIDSTRSDMRRWSKYPTLTDGEKRIQSALIRLETLLGEKGEK